VLSSARDFLSTHVIVGPVLVALSRLLRELIGAAPVVEQLSDL
jgi:hypothetical protein